MPTVIVGGMRIAQPKTEPQAVGVQVKVDRERKDKKPQRVVLPEQTAHAEAKMEFITRRLIRSIPRAIMGSRVEAERLSTRAVAVKQMLHEVGHEVLNQWLEAQDAKYPADERGCKCGGVGHIFGDGQASV